MKINVDLMPVIYGVVYGDFGITVTKGAFCNTYVYERIASIELSDTFMKIKLVNDIVVKIEFEPYRITLTEPELEIDTDEIPDDLLPKRPSNKLNLN